jgi:thiamine-phosphate pyrophosphorylase
VKAIGDCRLYTFVDTAFLSGRDPRIVAEQLCDGGADVVQIRAKDRKVEEVRRLAESILPITQRANVILVINDYPEIARELGAYVHLGQEDFFDAGYTNVSQLSPLRIGLSTHAPEQAERAMAANPAYIAIGPVYTTGTKPSARPVTLEYVRWAAQNVKIPWFAIGGINFNNIDEVLTAGAQRICVVSAILNAENISEACQRFRQRLTSALS